MQLVATDEKDEGKIVEIEPEIHEVDKLLAVKNWAMQSPDWKLFNVFCEKLNEKQLQYECKGGRTIFSIITSLLKLGMTKEHKVYHPDTKD